MIMIMIIIIIMIVHNALQVIKILQSRLAKPVTLKTHTKLMPVPVTSKPFSYKQIIQTVKQSRPTRVSKPIVQVQQQLQASPTASKTASLFDPLNTSRAPFQIPLQAHHIKWIQAHMSLQYTITNCHMNAHIMRVFTSINHIDKIAGFPIIFTISNNITL